MGQGYSDYSLMLSGNKESYDTFQKEFISFLDGNNIIKSYSSYNENKYNEYKKHLETLNNDSLETKTRRETTVKIEEIVKDARNCFMQDIEKSIAHKLSTSDVIALQEVIHTDRSLIKELEKKGFDIYYHKDSTEKNKDSNEKEERFSTAVAIKKDKFISVKNTSIPSKSCNKPDHKIYGKNIASVEATIKGTDIKMTFSSLHSWGFQLYDPNKKDTKEKKDFFLSANKMDQDQMNYGVKYVNEAINLVKDHKFSILGGDMNNNPQNFSEQFQEIEAKGFDVLEPNENTNINNTETYNYRKLDFIFIPKESLLSQIGTFISSIFYTTSTLRYTPAEVLKDFDFEYGKNCSDHKPVMTEITITTASSKLWQFCQKIYGLFCLCFQIKNKEGQDEPPKYPTAGSTDFEQCLNESVQTNNDEKVEIIN